MRKPNLERTHPTGSGTQRIYRFDNGYGASVVRFSVGPFGGSYGCESGLWELAVIRFDGPGLDKFHLTYDTPITDDVLGHLSGDEVDGVLESIEHLSGD